MEKAAAYNATAVFFEAGRHGRPPVAQAFLYVSAGPSDDPEFAHLHQQLWSWGGVPLLYRKLPGLVQLFRCAHGPDFVSPNGEIVCRPVKTLELASKLSADPWWSSDQLHNGTLWDDRRACSTLLSARKSAHKRLIDAISQLNDDLKGVLLEVLRRKLLILSLTIAYLEEREVFEEGYFGRFLPGAVRFFQVLAEGEALVQLLTDLEARFNGNVFSLTESERQKLLASSQLAKFAQVVEGHSETTGQLTLWKLYSFKDLPVELISHIYQLFVQDVDSSVYTPPFLVRLILDETLSWERLDRLAARSEVVVDPCCGSGVFLVEAYKRLILHWRSQHGWKKPELDVLKNLLTKVHGIDLEAGAIELAAFSLCLALCDALEPQDIRASVKLFPPLAGVTLHHSCFFEAQERRLIQVPVGAVVGNPPFRSRLGTPGAERSCRRYEATHARLPDKQLAYLFLHEAMEMVTEGGVLGMLQQYNFLYNQKSLDFRRDFLTRWNVRELLDFVSVRGLFHKGAADTKVIVVVAEATEPPIHQKLLHATFRRSGRIDAELGFDIDYYDLHQLPRELVLANDGIWRANLFGGGRVLALVDRLKQLRTLRDYATTEEWDFGEGFIVAKKGKLTSAEYITGKAHLPSDALTEAGLSRDRITIFDKTYFQTRCSRNRFTPPMLLIREHMDLPHALWTDSYLTYTQQIVGFCAPQEDTAKLAGLDEWLSSEHRALKAFVALTSHRLFAQKATALQAGDVLALPYPESGTLDLSANEQILVNDIVDTYRDLIRLGEDSAALKESGLSGLSRFADVLSRQIGAIYSDNPLHPLPPQSWPGILCQPFIFGGGSVDWAGASELQDRLAALLHDQQGAMLHVTRIFRVYDGSFVFLLKPDRLRYWLPSVALRDADEILADLRAQGI